jgi:hypothetical protein
MASAELSFGHQKDFLMVSMAIRASLYTSHFLLSCDPLGAGSHFHYLLHTPNGRHNDELN